MEGPFSPARSGAWLAGAVAFGSSAGASRLDGRFGRAHGSRRQSAPAAARDNRCRSDQARPGQGRAAYCFPGSTGCRVARSPVRGCEPPANIDGDEEGRMSGRLCARGVASVVASAVVSVVVSVVALGPDGARSSEERAQRPVPAVCSARDNVEGREVPGLRRGAGRELRPAGCVGVPADCGRPAVPSAGPGSVPSAVLSSGPDRTGQLGAKLVHTGCFPARQELATYVVEVK